ncbi:hypothetical protein NIES4075_68050 [Tolypothrix sp. NIES-4075]|nr:hypothetical protein NIES4075_68050 [Tolypothrix sp. NIES-4075]
MTCANFLQTYVDWIKGGSGTDEHFVSLNLISNDTNGPARYAEGRLHLETSIISPEIPLSFFVGEATLYESNERWGFPSDDGSFSLAEFPFNPRTTDKIKVTINLLTPSITITSSTKGKAIINNPQCSNNLIFGFVTEGSGVLGVGGFPDSGFPLPFRPYYVISLTTGSIPVP